MPGRVRSAPSPQGEGKDNTPLSPVNQMLLHVTYMCVFAKGTPHGEVQGDTSTTKYIKDIPKSENLFLLFGDL